MCEHPVPPATVRNALENAAELVDMATRAHWDGGREREVSDRARSASDLLLWADRQLVRESGVRDQRCDCGDTRIRADGSITPDIVNVHHNFDRPCVLISDDDD